MNEQTKYSFGEKLLLLFSLICFFPPSILVNNPKFYYIYLPFKYGYVAVVILLVTLRTAKSKGMLIIHKTSILIIVMFASLLLSSLLGEFSVSIFVRNSFKVLGVFIITTEMIEKSYDDFISYCFVFFTVILLVNNVEMIFTPNGMFFYMNGLGRNASYILATKNNFTTFSLPDIILGFLSYYRGLIKKRTLLFAVVMALFPPIVAHSMTTTFGLLFMLLIIALYETQIIKRNSTWIFLMVALAIFQIVFTYHNDIRIITYLTNVIMKKSIADSRMMLWNAAHDMISRNFLFGKGNGKDGFYFYTVAGKYSVGNIMWAHNTSLDILTQGGILLFTSYYVLLCNVVKRPFVVSKVIKGEGAILLAGICCFLLMGTTERYEFRTEFYFLLAIIASYSVLSCNQVTMDTVKTNN